MSLLASQWVPVLGWALVDFLWQGLLLGLLMLPLLGMLRNARPQARYALLLLALAACVALPLASVLRGLLSTALASAPVPSSGFIAPQFFDTGVLAAALPWQQRAEPYLPWIVATWSLGAGLLALRFMLGLSWVSRAREDGAPPAFQWQARLERLSAAIGLSAPPRLLLVRGLDGPAVAGWWRPVVMLPAALVARMPVDLLEALLAHELAHVKRHDYLVNLLQGAVESLLFYHPVVWWLSRRIRIERELIADELASRAIGQARPLALALQHLERMQAGLDHPFPPPQFAPAAHGGHLMNRIKHLLRPNASGLHWKSGLPLIGVTALCLAVYAQASSPLSKPAPASPSPATASAVAPVATVAPFAPVAAEASVAPVAAVAAAAPVEPFDVIDDRESSEHIFDGERDADPYALVDGKREGLLMSGDINDATEVRQLRQHLKGDFLWFRHDGKAYVVQDPALLASAEKAWGPARSLGEKMNVLGKQMEPHSAQMEALGKQMEAITARTQPQREQMEAASRAMEPLAEQQRELAEQMQDMSLRVMRADKEVERERLSRQMEQLSARMEPLNRQMSEIGQRMGQQGKRMQEAQVPMQELAEKMRLASVPMQELGERMRVLARQQEKLSHQADDQVKQVIQRALQEGKAEPSRNLSGF